MSLGWQAGVLLLVTALTGLACGLIAQSLEGVSGFWGALAAAAVSALTVIFIAVCFRHRGLSAETIVVSTLMRMMMTLLIAGAAVYTFVWLRTPVFFLSLAVIYVMNLFLETWFVLQKNQKAGRHTPSV